MTPPVCWRSPCCPAPASPRAPLAGTCGSADQLALARFVVETIDGEGPLSARTGGRLWLGSHNHPRLTDAQRIVDPATAEERRLACCGVEASAIRRITVDAVTVSDRASASRHLAEHPSLLWTVIGPDTVIVAPNNDYTRRRVAHRGVAAVPLGAHQAAVRALAEELELERVAELAAPHPLLFATGRWEDLGALLEAAAGPPETVDITAGGDEAAPAPSAPPREDG